MTEQNGVAAATAEAQAAPDAMDKIINEAAKTDDFVSDTSSAEEPKDELWPKKAVNALAKAKGVAAREKALRQEYERRLAAYAQVPEHLRGAKASESKPSAPKEEDFAGKPYGEYLTEVNKFQIEQALAERDKKSSQELSVTKQKEWEAERDEAFDENVEKASESFKDFDDVIKEHVKGKLLSPKVIEAFRHADEPALALYALAKDGLIDGLNEMSPHKLAAAIARAEDKAIALTKPKVTNAPTPMTANKGTSTGGKSLDAMSANELDKWRKSK